MATEDEWAAAAAGWDDAPEVRAYAAAAFDSLSSILEGHGVELAGVRVCDFGCGTGLLTERLVSQGASVDAIDSSPAMLAVLRDKVQRVPLPDVEVLAELPAPARPYDVVVCSSVCAFVPDYPGTATQLVGRLRAGGVFVQWDWERSDGEPHEPGLTRAEIRATLESSGLTGITVDAAFAVDVDGYVMRPLVGHGRRPDGV